MRPDGQPLVVPRSEHAVSRKLIDPDASGAYRLHQAGHTAYLVGGSVRDLCSRHPKDFRHRHVAHRTSQEAVPHCWIIGRRFRLATCASAPRRWKSPRSGGRSPRRSGQAAAEAEQRAAEEQAEERSERDAHRDRLIHRDNTFGTPEEDAFPPRFHDQRALLRHRDVLDHRLHDGARGPAGGVIRSIGIPTSAS